MEETKKEKSQMIDSNGIVFNTRIIYFEKVSFEQFWRDVKHYCSGRPLPDAVIHDWWENIQLPKRATSGSAGYDFYLPVDEVYVTGDSVTIPSGIRCVMPQGLVLMLFPRSGLSFKHGTRLMNTCGIIDSDFAEGKTEGHILVKMVSDYPFYLHKGDRYVQGLLLPYAITSDDAADGQRTGGIGSTGE